MYVFITHLYGKPYQKFLKFEKVFVKLSLMNYNNSNSKVSFLILMFLNLFHFCFYFRISDFVKCFCTIIFSILFYTYTYIEINFLILNIYKFFF